MCPCFENILLRARGKTLDARCVCFAESENKISSFVAGEFIYLTIESAASFYTHEETFLAYFTRILDTRDLVCIYYIPPFIIDPRTKEKEQKERERVLRKGKKERGTERRKDRATRETE